MASLFDGIGTALGGLLGGLGALGATNAGVDAVGGLTAGGAGLLEPFRTNGVGFQDGVNSTLLGHGPAGGSVGYDRVGASGNPVDYNQFMAQRNAGGNPVDFENFASNYNTSEGARYLMDTAASAQDNSAAARGGLLSGANLRAQTGIAEGIANQDLLSHYQANLAGQQQNFSQDQQAYGANLAGQQQDFGQREQSYQNLYGQQALGENAATGQAATFASGARSIGSLYGGLTSAATTAGNSVGSGLGSVFSGLLKAFS